MSTDKFKTYSPDTLAELIGGNSKNKREFARKLAVLAKSTGIYRDLDGEMFFTESDARDLLEAMRVRQGARPVPMPDDRGYVLVLGNPKDRVEDGAVVWLSWVHVGQLDATYRTVRNTNADPGLTFFEAIPCTYAQYIERRVKIAPHVHHGYWYKRCDLVDSFASLFPNTTPTEGEFIPLTEPVA